MSYRDEMRRWRGSFTRDNYEGAARLRHDLRNKGLEATGRSWKDAAVERDRKADAKARQDAQDAAVDLMPFRCVDTRTESAEVRARIGVKSRTIYGRDAKIEQTFDDLGRLVKEEVVPL